MGLEEPDICKKAICVKITTEIKKGKMK